MRISSISNHQYINRASQDLYRSHEKLSSGKRINKAADDAAGAAIAQKILSEFNGLNKATQNAATFQDMTKVADGAMDTVTSSLQRMRELSVQASNDLYSDSDREAIQQEIDQLKQHISDTAGQTQFNGKNLLDNSDGTWHAAINSNGGGMDVNMPVSTLEKLGLADYDVTGDFDIGAIDDALDMVNADRSSLGAVYNRLDYSMSNNSYTALNTAASHSRIEDLDYGKAVTDQQKQKILLQYTMMMQRRKYEDENGRVIRLYNR